MEGKNAEDGVLVELRAGLGVDLVVRTEEREASQKSAFVLWV